MKADNLRGLATLIKILAWGVFALALTSGVLQAIWLATYSQMVESAIVLVIAGLASVGYVVAYLLSVIPVLIWIYLAHGNLERAGIGGLRYNKAWVVISYFIPFVNWVIPFRAMRELANRSAGEPEELAESSVEEVGNWWACFLGAVFFGTIVSISASIDAIPGFFVTTPFWANQILTILSLVLMAGSAWFFNSCGQHDYCRSTEWR